MTLLAAAALLLVGGALAAGSGVLRRQSVVPPVPAPSVGAVAIASPSDVSEPEQVGYGQPESRRPAPDRLDRGEPEAGLAGAGPHRTRRTADPRAD